MSYEETKYEVQKVGTQKQGKVTEINEGQIKDFVAEEHHKKFNDVEQKAIEIKAEFEDGSSRTHMIALPNGTSVNPNSKMGQWIKAYGGQPKVGQEVYVTLTADGYFEFAQ